MMIALVEVSGTYWELSSLCYKDNAAGGYKSRMCESFGVPRIRTSLLGAGI